MASLAQPTGSRIAFSVKNTFVDSLSDDDDDELAFEGQPSRALRSFTAPATAVGSASCSEAESDDDACAPQVGRAPSPARVTEADRLPTVTVKNTFVDLPDRSPSVGQALLSRCITAPVRSRSFSSCASDEDAFLADPSLQEQAATCAEVEDHGDAFLPCSTPTPWGTKSVELGFCSTPTPWGTKSAELGFWTLAGARPSPAALSLEVPTPAAPAAEVPSVTEGKITAVAHDKSLAITQAGSSCVVQWTVETKRLRGNDKQVVSAPFEITLREGAPPAVFKLMLYAQSDVLGTSTSFQKSSGVGCMQLKCCSDLSAQAQRTAAVRFCVGGQVAQAARGPVAHQFHASSVCALPKHQSIWDFKASAVKSPNFTITVELSPIDFAHSNP